MYKLDYAVLLRRSLGGTRGSPGRRLVSAPLLIGGYILLVTGVARLVANSLGWSANLFVIGLGALHLALGIVIVTAGTAPEETVNGPPLPAAATLEMALERAHTLVMDTLVMDRSQDDRVATAPPPLFPPRAAHTSISNLKLRRAP